MLAVVTGGASGIGAGIVAALRKQGRETVVWDVQSLDDPASVVCDVSDPRSVDEAMTRTAEHYGVPRVLVTAAGVGSDGPLLDLDSAEWDRVLGINLRGAMLCVQAAARVMAATGGGSIVCVSSITGRMPTRGLAAYCCSKAGVDMLVKVAAAELGVHGIRVNAIAPGITETPMNAGFRAIPGMVDRMGARTPLGGIATPAMIAEAVLAILGMQWVTGQTLVADGGLTLYAPLDD
jgi:NAD(P)-dependent dehydrogenase (short-subunit alcohol dehydrogenase family)